MGEDELRGQTSRIFNASAMEMSLKSTSSPEAVFAAPVHIQKTINAQLGLTLPLLGRRGRGHRTVGRHM